MTQVVGYAFNADMWCIECTIEYCEEQLKKRGIDYSKLTLEDMTLKCKDRESNNLHAVFDIDEQIDHDAACGSYDRDKHAVIVKYANYFSHIDSITKYIKSNTFGYIYNEYKKEIDDIQKDSSIAHKDNDDHECYLTFYVRFDRSTGDLANYELNASDMCTEPFTNSTNYVFAITACPAYIYDLDEFKDELESSVGEIYN